VDLMARLILRRAVHSAIILFCVITVVFVVTHVVGDPARILVGPDGSQAQYQSTRIELGLNKPLPNQFVTYLGQLARFDLGFSHWQLQPVNTIIGQRLPVTVELAVLAMALSLLIAVPLGIIGAVRKGSLLDRGLTIFSVIGLSLPLPWVGLMLMLLFAVDLGWLPATGQGNFTHLILPSLTLAIPNAGRTAVIVRTSMIEALKRPWMRSARAQGLSQLQMVGVLALRNAGVGILTFVSWEFILMLAGGVVLAEYVFGLGGMGYTLLLAINHQDIVLTQALVLVIAAIVVFSNLLVDLAYIFIDPRIRLN
jgi:peptide/nickel transport system permease protein